jgi:hypothetical protein
MSYKMNDAQFRAVSALPGVQRYAHFIKRVVDWAEVWILRNAEGWVFAAGDEGPELVPVWPHERYAQACAVGAWEGTTPEAISLKDWIERWTPRIARDGLEVTVFPLPVGPAVRVTPQRLADDLLAYADLWYDGLPE